MRTRTWGGCDRGRAALHGNVNYSKTCKTDCTCTGWLSRRRVFEEGDATSSHSRQCARTYHRLVNRRSRERSVFGRHNASASIILDDRRLINYCRGTRSPGIYNFKRDVALCKFPNFAKWASLSALARKRTSDTSITIVNPNVIRFSLIMQFRIFMIVKLMCL